MLKDKHIKIRIEQCLAFQKHQIVLDESLARYC